MCMRIGLFTDSYLPLRDGVATAVASCARELELMGHSVSIIAPDCASTKDGDNVYRVRSIRLFKEPEIHMGLPIPQQVITDLTDIDFDVIHGHTGGPISLLGWKIARTKHIPYVATYHTLWKHYTHYFFIKNLLKPWMFEKTSGMFGNICDAVIAPTNKVKKELQSYGVKKPIVIIPNGIYIERFRDQKKGFLRQSYSIPIDKKILLTVGRLEKEKSVDFLIASFALLHKQDENIVFVIVGEGRDKEKLHQLAIKNGVNNSIYFTGAIEHTAMPSVYADADLFIFGSDTETQGMVIIEALASGVGVLTIQDTAFQTSVLEGWNGYMVTKKPSIFAKRMHTLMQQPLLRKQLGKNALESATAYSIHQTAYALVQLYDYMIFSHKNRQFSFLTKSVD
jgi:1,2-diacylglycerol 3-alpha-glucosyltransferase